MLMNSNSPLVSIIIPAYNADAFIAATLDSVIAQTYGNFEVLVVDDGSRDRTPEIVRSYREKDSRIRLLQQANGGVAAARNLAISQAGGELIAPLDADDVWHPRKLEKQVACMQQSGPEVGLVYTWSAHIDEAGFVIGHYSPPWLGKPEGYVYPILVYANFLDNASTPLIRKGCFDRVGGYNCDFKQQNAQGCEDWDIYLRIAEFYQFRVVPEFLVGYRQVIGSMATNSLAMARSYELVMQQAQKYHPEIPPIIHQWSSSIFYDYLLGKSYQNGHHRMALYWLQKVLQQDKSLLLRPGLYRLFLTCLIKLAIHPVTSRIWPSHRDWLQFKKHLLPQTKGVTIGELEQQMQRRSKQPWKPYDLVLQNRWIRVLDLWQQTPLSSDV